MNEKDNDSKFLHDEFLKADNDIKLPEKLKGENLLYLLDNVDIANDLTDSGKKNNVIKLFKRKSPLIMAATLIFAVGIALYIKNIPHTNDMIMQKSAMPMEIADENSTAAVATGDNQASIAPKENKMVANAPANGTPDSLIQAKSYDEVRNVLKASFEKEKTNKPNLQSSSNHALFSNDFDIDKQCNYTITVAKDGKTIININDKKTNTKLSEITLSKNCNFDKILINNNDMIISSIEINNSIANSRLDIYDINDKTKPSLINSITQSGIQQILQVQNDKLFLSSKMILPSTSPSDLQDEQLIPCIFDKNKNNKDLISSDSILICPGDIYTKYEIISVIDTKDFSVLNSTAILCCNQNISIKNDTIILEDENNIFAFSMDDKLDLVK